MKQDAPTYDGGGWDIDAENGEAFYLWSEMQDDDQDVAEVLYPAWMERDPITGEVPE